MRGGERGRERGGGDGRMEERGEKAEEERRRGIENLGNTLEEIEERKILRKGK